MRWNMRREFKIAYEKAKLVLDRTPYEPGKMVRTADIINAVKNITDIEVKFLSRDFSTLTKDVKKQKSYESYGAAMCTTEHDGKRTAVIFLNERETPEMKRFSLIHELGHLITHYCDEDKSDGLLVSTHIDMDITSIPDEILDRKGYEFLIDEQVANIFALLVLIPYDSLIDALEKTDSVEKAAQLFGVEKDALISRLMLEETL